MNAGIAIDGGIDTPTDKRQKIIDVNLLSQVFAARYAVPHMLEQGSGYLLNVASAAGLLVIFDTVSYTVTKHASIGFDHRGSERWRASDGSRSPAWPDGLMWFFVHLVFLTGFKNRLSGGRQLGRRVPGARPRAVHDHRAAGARPHTRARVARRGLGQAKPLRCRVSRKLKRQTRTSAPTELVRPTARHLAGQP